MVNLQRVQAVNIELNKVDQALFSFTFNSEWSG